MINKTNQATEHDEKTGKTFQYYDVGDLKVVSGPFATPAFAFKTKGGMTIVVSSTLPQDEQDKIIEDFIATGGFPKKTEPAAN